MTTSLMFSEAEEAATIAARQIAANRDRVNEIAARLRALDAPFAATLARGSSDHAASFAKTLFETRLRVPVVSHPPSIASLYHATSPRLAGVPMLAISQSGRSPDLIAAAREAQAVGAVVIALVNDEQSPLAQLADYVLPLHAGPERSVAATKSFIASLVAIAQLTAAWSGDEVLGAAIEEIGPAIGRSFGLDWGDALPLLIETRTMLVLGRGLTLPIAGEAALKFKETSALHAEAFSIAEVAHGPMTLIEQGDPVFVFAPEDAAREGTADRIRAFAERGARVIAAGDAADTEGAEVRLPIVRHAHPVVGAIGQIASFYKLAEALARARGRDPDRPPYLAKVTQTL
jgi:glucosamine--fructose-6-phosphate aminotransferase (isomerizing)